MIKFLVAIIVIAAVLAAVWCGILWQAAREMEYPGVDDIGLNDNDIKAGR